MVYELVIKSIVFIDVEQAVVFYANKSKELANKFYNNFLQSLSEIQRSPQNYSFITKQVRRHVIKKFPYKIFYLVTNDKIIVIGVSHAKRSNTYIKSRLRIP